MGRRAGVSATQRAACFGRLVDDHTEERPAGGGRTHGGAHPALLQLVQLLCEQRPAEVADILTETPAIVRDFFNGSDVRVARWFGHFSMDGLSHFRHGAFALAHWALAERGEAWQHLVWAGRHPQAPVAVAAKTHYFCELDILATAHRLLDDCPAFWSSPHLRDSLRDGAFLDLDRTHFCEVLLGMLSGAEGARAAGRLRRLLEAYLAEESWPLLCRRLLHLLDEDRLLQAVNALVAAPHQRGQPPGGWDGRSDAGWSHRDDDRRDDRRDGRRDGRRDTHSPHARDHSGEDRSGSSATPAAGRGRESAPPAVPFATGDAVQDLSEVLFGGGVRWATLGDAVLCHALACSRAQLMQVLREDEDQAATLQALQLAAQRLHGPGAVHSPETQSALLAVLVRDARSSSPSRSTAAAARLLLLANALTLRLRLQQVALSVPPALCAAVASLGRGCSLRLGPSSSAALPKAVLLAAKLAAAAAAGGTAGGTAREGGSGSGAESGEASPAGAAGRGGTADSSGRAAGGTACGTADGTLDGPVYELLPEEDDADGGGDRRGRGDGHKRHRRHRGKGDKKRRRSPRGSKHRRHKKRRNSSSSSSDRPASPRHRSRTGGSDDDVSSDDDGSRGGGAGGPAPSARPRPQDTTRSRDSGQDREQETSPPAGRRHGGAVEPDARGAGRSGRQAAPGGAAAAATATAAVAPTWHLLVDGESLGGGADEVADMVACAAFLRWWSQ